MTHSFTPQEVYVLVQAAGYPAIVGCADVNNCQFTPRESSEKARPLLQEKDILTSENHLTEHGMAVVSFLAAYCQHEEFTFINRCIMGFQKNEGMGIVKVASGYQLVQMSRQEWLEETYLRHELLQGEVKQEEQKRRRMIRRKEKEELTQQDYPDHLAVGHLRLKNGKLKDVEEWLLFKKEQEFIEIEVHHQEVYKISQGLVNKRVVDVMGVPYELERKYTL